MIPSTIILSQKYQMNLPNNTILFVVVAFLLPTSNGATSKLFREYIGADLEGIKFTDVPINPNVDFHFILSFTIDYTKTVYPVPTDGNFNVFWYTESLCPTDVSAIKTLHQNVKIAVSLGGDTVATNQFAYFAPKSISSWVSNAVVSLTQITKMYHLDGIDIDYEHFSTDPDTFAECIGQLITILKNDQIISFASIAPYANSTVQEHYQALWRKYGHVIDYVNFQFYAYDDVKTADKYIGYFQEQMSNYEGAQILASFATDGSGGLAPNNEFFAACGQLKKEGKLGGIFVWSADDSKKDGYSAEVQCQQLLASD